tara:strand:- start:2472 stop:3680 length:1209 start_codon:yes stop_codon:yes gene_type:complete
MKKKIRILLISQFFWPESFPINNIVKHFKEIDFDIITAKPNYPHGSIFKNYRKFGLIKEKFYTHNLYHVPIIPRLSGKSIYLFLNYLSFVISSILFGSLYLRKKKFDLVFVYNTSPITQILVGNYFKLFFKAKLITWVQDIWPESVSATDHLSENLIFKLFRKYCHYLYRLNDLLILQSKDFIKYFKKYKIYNKSVYIPNSSNLIKKKKIFKNQLIKKFKYNFVYAGNIGLAQDFENFELFLQKLYKKNQNIKFHLIGSGVYKNTLIKKIKKKNVLNIEIYPYIKNKFLYSYLKEADVLFLSLKNNYIFNLTLPSKLQNYLFCRKPILAWADGITKQIINESKCGIVVRSGNVNELVKASLELVKKHNIKKFSKNSGFYYKENFHLKIIKNKLLQSFINEIK